MIRLIIAALLVYAVYRVWRNAAALRRGARRRGAGGASSAAEMTACSRCGTFVLNSEARSRGGRIFCCDECAEKNDS